jgi:2-oxoisovalerate dehydrogenase E1 component alpha subunit
LPNLGPMKTRAALKKAVPVHKPASASQRKITATATTVKKSNLFMGLSKDLLLQMHELMVKSRILEERLIKIYRAGESFFWIGGPGEEAWGVPLGLLARKGQGVGFDFLHLHYRCTPTMVALGMPMIEAIRLMMTRATDVSTGGRNFAGHYCFPQWNVAPVTSPIEVQYPIACGTAHAQKRAKTKAISIVSGGDAGTAEGDFASCLVWASRRGQELPMLITCQNNRWGISTAFEGQHGERTIANRAKGFEIRARVINGNDPIESYLAIEEEMDYIRRTGKPSFIEAQVSRLYGHSSASGANFEKSEIDCVSEFETKLLKAGILKEARVREIWRQAEAEGVFAAEQARAEPAPQAKSIWDQVYVNNENADWRKF